VWRKNGWCRDFQSGAIMVSWPFIQKELMEGATQKVNFADCYVLTYGRTKAAVTSFLDRFLPQRAEYADRYELPQFSDNPVIEFQTAEQLLDYLEQDLHTVHAIYWYNPEDTTIRAAMALFTSDGQVILGLTCECHKDDDSVEQGCLKELMAFCRSTVGLIEYEKPAPKDTDELLQRIGASSGHKEGKA
jgi:hypothetical protein